MANIRGTQLEDEVEHDLKRQGFHIVAQRAFSKRFLSKADFIVEQKGKRVAVEVKSRPAMMSDIAAVGQFRRAGLIGTLLCMPDVALKRIPTSVRSYADQLGVRLCSTDEVGNVLKTILN